MQFIVFLITGWNEEAERVYGYSAEEILGKHTSILAPPHLDKETSKLSKMIKQGKKSAIMRLHA